MVRYPREFCSQVMNVRRVMKGGILVNVSNPNNKEDKNEDKRSSSK